MLENLPSNLLVSDFKSLLYDASRSRGGRLGLVFGPSLPENLVYSVYLGSLTSITSHRHVHPPMSRKYAGHSRKGRNHGVEAMVVKYCSPVSSVALRS